MNSIPFFSFPKVTEKEAEGLELVNGVCRAWRSFCCHFTQEEGSTRDKDILHLKHFCCPVGTFAVSSFYTSPVCPSQSIMQKFKCNFRRRFLRRAEAGRSEQIQ